MNLQSIKRDEIDLVATLCASSFKDDPLFVFFFPNPKERQKKAQVFFKAQLKMCQSFTFVLEDKSGAIIYQRPKDKIRPLSIKDGFLLISSSGILSLIKAIVYQRFSKKILSDINNKEMDHLVLICVDEKARNKGLATKMIHDLSSSSTYLETQNPNNLTFYKNLGFQLHQKESFRYCGGSYDHYVLIKDPIRVESSL
ncbi:MAG: GNAT family N-acetyltransferase [Erysipelotrichaceae bacterium]|nr:GNAT family N-acetyltransferase [Erysipelotrichaceae bacterium]